MERTKEEIIETVKKVFRVRHSKDGKSDAFTMVCPDEYRDETTIDCNSEVNYAGRRQDITISGKLAQVIGSVIKVSFTNSYHLPYQVFDAFDAFKCYQGVLNIVYYTIELQHPSFPVSMWVLLIPQPLPQKQYYLISQHVGSEEQLIRQKIGASPDDLLYTVFTNDAEKSPLEIYNFSHHKLVHFMDISIGDIEGAFPVKFKIKFLWKEGRGKSTDPSFLKLWSPVMNKEQLNEINKGNFIFSGKNHVEHLDISPAKGSIPPFSIKENLDMTVRKLSFFKVPGVIFEHPIDVYFLDSTIECLTETVSTKNGLKFFTHIRFIFNEKELKKHSQGKYIPEYINLYKYLLTIPTLQDQRDTLHRYVAYFESRTDLWKKPIYWLTEDYNAIIKPIGVAVGLYALFIVLFSYTPLLGGTTSFTQIYKLAQGVASLEWNRLDLWMPALSMWDNLLRLTLPLRNILRWILFEIPMGYCMLSIVFAIKKRFGMGSPKDTPVIPPSISGD